MTRYKERFPVGSMVQVLAAPQLVQFAEAWKHHHPLTTDQLACAGRLAEVLSVSFYHGGDVLYQLKAVPGTWHEACLMLPNHGDMHQ